MQGKPNLPELWSAAVSEGAVVGGQGGGVQDDLGVGILCFGMFHMVQDDFWFELWNGFFNPR